MGKMTSILVGGKIFLIYLLSLCAAAKQSQDQVHDAKPYQTTDPRGTCKAITLTERYQSLIHEIISQKQERQIILSMPGVATICDMNEGTVHKPHFDKEPQTWYKVLDRKLYVFSAFYERRELADGPAIRIIASGWQEQFNEIGELYCHLWYEDKPYPVVVGPALYHRIYPSLSHPDMYVSHFILCKLPNLPGETLLPVPYAVSVVPKPCIPAGNDLMVLNREEVEQKGEHALCISPLYGHFKNWTMVAEMFELQKLLGAEAITIYKFSIMWFTEKLLEGYLQDPQSNVDVVNWRSYPPVKSNVWCQRGALNDCLYRMGHRYKYVTITDLDEVLVPRMEPTWPRLMKHIAKPDIGAYLFQHAYFRRNYTEEANSQFGLISQTSLWRTDKVTPPGKIRCKAMYLAKNAISIDLHFPYLLVQDAKEYILEPEEGMLHHYRAYPMESFIKHPDRYNFIEDKHMEKYKTELEKRFKPRIDDARSRF